jgi:hypothetical protein
MTKRRAASLLVAASLLWPTLVQGQRQTRKLFVWALDDQDAPVLDLSAGDFTLREAGKTREITSARLSSEPLRVALLIDSSEESERALNDIRAGLDVFLTTLPQEHEVALITIGRQLRVRVQPTLDRARLRDVAKQFSADGGGTVLLDGARETNDRFMRRAEDRWPVMVIVTTDGPERSGTTHDDDYLRFLQDLVLRQTTVHTILLQRSGGGMPAEIASNLAQNTGGRYDALLTSNQLANRMKALAERLADDHRRMSTAYELDYPADAKDPRGGIELGVTRNGVKLQASPRRPM